MRHVPAITPNLVACDCGQTRTRDGLPDDAWGAVSQAWAIAHADLERMLNGGICVAGHEACEECGAVICYGSDPCYGQAEPGCLHDRDLCIDCVHACRFCAADIREERSR